jgi:hypothetical protein
MKDLKHKNLIILGTISALAIVSVLVATSMNRGDIRGRQEALVASAYINPASFLIDSSGDGMYDWEKSLWGLDPLLNDNSGDGIPDVEKIRAGKDPRLVPPNDDLTNENMPVYLRIYEEPTKTQEFTQEFYAGFRALANSGNLTNDTLSGLLNYLSTKLELGENGNGDNVAATGRYSLSDISTTGSSREQMTSYGNALGQLLIKYSSEPTANEFEILVRSIEAGGLVQADQFENILQLYEEAISDLTKMSVPSLAAENHINVVNSLYNIKTSVFNAGNTIFSDPISGILSLREYQSELLAFSVAVNSIKKQLIESLVYYEETEPGFILLYHSF